MIETKKSWVKQRKNLEEINTLGKSKLYVHGNFIEQHIAHFVKGLVRIACNMRRGKGQLIHEVQINLGFMLIHIKHRTGLLRRKHGFCKNC